MRVDRYKLLIEQSAVSPRLGIAYHIHQTGTVLRGSYSRLFMPPFSENLLLSSSDEARAITPDSSGEDVQPEKQHAFEVGIQQALSTHAKLDVASCRKDIRNVADVDQFLDTTVTFPLSVAKGLAQGIEARLDVPVYKGINGYVSLARAKILLTAPLTGGLFLEDTPPAGEQFYADHDQRWQSQFGVSYEHPTQRFFASFTGRFDSGIPFELPDDFESGDVRGPARADAGERRHRPRPFAHHRRRDGRQPVVSAGNDEARTAGRRAQRLRHDVPAQLPVDLQRHPLRRAAHVDRTIEGWVLGGRAARAGQAGRAGRARQSGEPHDTCGSPSRRHYANC
ncbi:MAG: TonB-dependent receptor [Vicinamibacterales bacterium]